MTQLTVNLNEKKYIVTIGHNILSSADKYFNLDRRVFILTDCNVPKEYASAIAGCAREAKIVTIQDGERSKSIETLELVLSEMLSFGLTRSDCAVAVGGGVIGDLLGFAASIYMRGIEFYNVPTTTLSQIDSSIGGKTAINFSGIKNIVGAFYQPSGVLIDIDTLKTLSSRHFSAGLCEAVKMALTSDATLFEFIEKNGVTDETLEHIITASLEIKRRVVEEDERECGIRKILNLGHTLGHGIEALSAEGALYHGECVALGMLPVVSEKARERLIPILKALSLPTEYHGDIDSALELCSYDKKKDGDLLSIIYVGEIGSFEIKKMSVSDFRTLVKEGIDK